MNFSAFDLNLLRVLDALLQERSTVKAAERVGLSQPAVSNALGRLRHALGDELLIRQGQRLVPTDFALGLSARLREELDRLETMLSGPDAFDPGSAVLTFRLAGSDFFAELLMPRLATSLCDTAPGIRVQLVELLRDSYVGTIDRYSADLSLIPDEAFPEWICSTPLFRSSFVAIGRRGHPGLASVRPGSEMPVDIFCALEHVVFSPEGNFSAMGDRALANIGRTRRVKMTLPVFSGVCRAVADTDLISLVPRQLAEKMAPAIGLSIYRPPMPIPTPLIVGIWHRRSNADPAHIWMRKRISEILRPLNDGEQPI